MFASIFTTKFKANNFEGFSLLNSYFNLNKTLETDSYSLGKLNQIEIRLVKFYELPWFLLVPHENQYEFHELSPQNQLDIINITKITSKEILKLTSSNKINSGYLGNVVKQFHWHVVGRSENDPAWPDPVWGFDHQQRANLETAQMIFKEVESIFKK